MAITASISTPQATATTTATKQGLNQMSSDDFLKVLITQLQYQDPMKPMDSDQMLSQISQIRNMEMSTTLTDSLKNLTEQQRLGSAASLIGGYVTGTVTGSDGTQTTINGVVRGIRFEADGEPILQLDSGGSLPLKSLQDVSDPNRLVGKYVTGVTLDENDNPVNVSGVVAAVKYGTDGSAWLELTSGDTLPMAGVATVGQAPAGSSTETAQAASKDSGVTAKLRLG